MQAKTIHLGTQYYRAPFPAESYWSDDLKRMKDAGLDTVQLWVLWGWVEASPVPVRALGDDRFAMSIRIPTIGFAVLAEEGAG